MFGGVFPKPFSRGSCKVTGIGLSGPRFASVTKAG